MANSIISPFDIPALDRLRQMGFLNTDNQINTSILAAANKIHAGLLFDQICDSCGGKDGALTLCHRLIEQATSVSERQVLLLISIQYDKMVKPLPDVIWWLSGSEALLPPFIRCFMQNLAELCVVEESKKGCDGMVQLTSARNSPLRGGITV